MVKNRSLFVRESCLWLANWLEVVGLALLLAIAGPALAGQVIDDDDSGSSQQQAPASPTRSGGGDVLQPNAVQQYPSDQSRTDGKSTKQIVAKEIGQAIGQAIVQSIVQQGAQPAPSSSRSYSRNPEPNYSTTGGRRPKDDRF